MQRITYRVQSKSRLAKAKFQQMLSQRRKNRPTSSNFVSSTFNFNSFNQPKIRKTRFDRFTTTKKVLQISSLALLSLPAQSFTNKHSQMPILNQVLLSKTLTVAAVPGDSTFFATDNFQHGFGYDLTRSYANTLGVDINLKTYANADAALKAVKSGQADVALTNVSTQKINDMDLASINLSCGWDSKLTENGLHPKISWTFANSHDGLSVKASQFLCDNTQVKHTQKLAKFYNQNLLKDAYNQQHFTKTLSEKLPNYQTMFQEQADEYNHDWQLLVAMGYQESHLNANAISPTGVQGLMMLTNSTAKAMGVSNRVDPIQSISGGAKYLEEMKAQFADVPQTDRLWFALAAYNMGPNAVKRIQSKLQKQGLDANSWSNVYAYLNDHAASNGRYVQCMHYVSNIRSYLESIKTQSV